MALLTCLVSFSIMLGTVAAGPFRQPEDLAVSAEEEFSAGFAAADGQKLVLALMGDVLLAEGVGQAIASHGPEYPWQDAADQIRGADLAIANLECPVSAGGQPEPGKEYTFRADPGALAGAVKAGLDVFTLANNHVLDYGREALLDTVRHLEEKGLSHAGAGAGEAGAVKPALLNVKDKKVAVLAFSRIIPRSDWIATPEQHGVASGHHYQLMLESVREAAAGSDLTVVSLHWGNEYDDFPGPGEVKLAHELVDAGADVVVGHHPHVLQGIEIYKGRIIAYSLGNFIFTTSPHLKGREGAILQVTAGGEEYQARVIPTGIDRGAVKVLRGKERKGVLDRLSQLCQTFKTSVDERGVLHIIE